MGKLLQTYDEKIRFLRDRTATCFKLQGRRPRIMITRIPSNDSERSVKSVATAFAEVGFDVDINLSILPPAALARIAIDNDVQAIGIPCIASDSRPYVTELLLSLTIEDDQSILVVAWMPVNAGEFGTSFNPGIGDFIIFGPETDYNDSASQILDSLE